MIRLFVGGLPYAMTEEELRDLFVPLGEVGSASIVTDRYTGRSRGFGFVDMTNDEEARKAVQELNGQSVGGRTITVNEARAQERRGGGEERRGGGDERRGGGGGGYGGGGGRGGGGGGRY